MSKPEWLFQYCPKLVLFSSDWEKVLLARRHSEADYDGTFSFTGGKIETTDKSIQAGITVNKNTVPYDPRPPFDPSGIRLGTPALTTRGMKESDMEQIADWIDEAINHNSDETSLNKLRDTIREFTKTFPLPSDKND
jgi:glycine/serine hydroxymethyltransferase